MVKSRVNTSHGKREFYKSLIRKMPEFSPKTLANPQYLVDMGIWKCAPAGWEEMLASPRYFAGRRQVLIYKRFEGSQELFTSHQAKLIKIEKPNFVVESDGQELRVPIDDVAHLNQPHVFARDILGHLSLEDGLKCDYSSLDVKFKLIQICLALKPIVEQMDFSSPAVLKQQVQCV